MPKGSRLGVTGLQWLNDAMLKHADAEARLAAVKKFAELAAGLGVKLPALAIAWCLKNPQVSTVILGASKPEQLVENLTALDAVEKLTPAVMRDLDRISAPLAE